MLEFSNSLVELAALPMRVKKTRTLFKEMSFNDLYRLQLDIETYCAEGYEFSNPYREEDRITVISLSDSTGWEYSISFVDLINEMVEEDLKLLQNR